MKKVILLCSLLAMGKLAVAQNLTLPELFSVLDLSSDKIDTLMKRKEYRLMQKESDSGVNLIYYTNLERNPVGATWVRSLTCREISVNKGRGRMITYRTYRKKEYLELLEWMLRNNFKTIKRENFGEYIDTVYGDGKRSIMVKQAKQKLPSGVSVWSYEFELGK